MDTAESQTRISKLDMEDISMATTVRNTKNVSISTSREAESTSMELQLMRAPELAPSSTSLAAHPSKNSDPRVHKKPLTKIELFHLATTLKSKSPKSRARMRNEERPV